MSAIASVLVAMGHRVSGTDASTSPVLDRLRSEGVDARPGHDPSAVAGVDAVVVSTAIPTDDPEVLAAREAGVPVVRRAGALAAISRARRTLAVSGTHGKTTTTAMLAVLLQGVGQHPSFLVGAEVAGIGRAATWDAGEWFIVEADESDGTFLELDADAVLVTNVEPDHLDHWGTFDALRAAFRTFIAQASGPRVVCADDPVASALAGEVGGCVTYGTGDHADARITAVETDRSGTRFCLDGHPVLLRVPGLHNARNAAGSLVMCRELGIDLDAAIAALEGFTGVARRFEQRGDARGVTFIDSYDHLPTEVASVLAAARAGDWHRIVCVFQPHRYTRTAALWRDFAGAFVDADIIAVTDIYPAGQEPIPGVTGKLIVNAVLDAHPRSHLAWLPDREGLKKWLLHELRPGDLCLTLGAGDLTTLPDDLLVTLSSDRSTNR